MNSYIQISYKTQKKNLGFGFGPRTKPKPQRDPDSEFNSLHFGIEIKKFLRKKNILGLKNFLFFVNICIYYSNFKLASQKDLYRNL